MRGRWSGAPPSVWQNGRLYPSGRSTSCPPDRTPTPEHPAPRAIRARSRRAHQMKWSDHHRGRQDPTQAHGQDPCTVLPRRRHGLAHQARWPGHRGDRQVPPHRGALAHPDRQRACAVLARPRRAADRGRRRPPEDHRRLAEVQGRAGHRGHPEGQGAQDAEEGPLRGRPRRRRQGHLGRRFRRHHAEEARREEGRGGPRRGGRPRRRRHRLRCRVRRERRRRRRRRRDPGPAAEAPAAEATDGEQA